MDCPICYNSINYSAIGSCTHHFCYDCLIKWCEFGGTKCPICKIFITHIRHDGEFDILNGKKFGNDKPLKNNSNIITVFKKDESAGITLKNNYSNNTRAPGIIISKINEKCKCYESGLRKNDIILFINNIPCIDHKQTINIINECVISSTQMICSLFKKRI